MSGCQRPKNPSSLLGENCYRSGTISNLSGIDYVDNSPENPVLLPGDFSLRTTRLDNAGDITLGFRTLRQGGGIAITEVNDDNSLLISATGTAISTSENVGGESAVYVDGSQAPSQFRTLQSTTDRLVISQQLDTVDFTAVPTVITDTPDTGAVTAEFQNNTYHTEAVPGSGDYVFRGLLLGPDLVNVGRDVPAVAGYNSIGWNYASQNPARYVARVPVLGNSNAAPILPAALYNTVIYATATPPDTTSPNYASAAVLATGLIPTLASQAIVPPITTYYNIAASVTLSYVEGSGFGSSVVITVELLDGGMNVVQLSRRAVASTGEAMSETLELNASLLLTTGVQYQLRVTVRTISTSIVTGALTVAGHLAISELI